MSPREVELWIDGQMAFWDRIIDVLAWHMAGLINVHIPKGKTKVTPDKVRPKRAKPSKTPEQEETELEDALESTLPTLDARMEYRERVSRRRREAAEDRAYWQSAEGRRFARRARR